MHYITIYIMGNTTTMENTVTFKIHNVEPVDPTEIAKLQKHLKPFSEVAINRLKTKTTTPIIEASSSENQQYGYNTHGLLNAVYDAYNHHIPLELSYDDIKLMILQGFALHINENAEHFRKSLVNHEGKKKIEIRRDGFVKGGKNNNWNELFGQFAEKIKNDIKDPTLVDMIQRPSVTSSEIAVASFNIALMETVQKYYEYVMTTKCGIPSITIKGNNDDFVSLMELVNYIEKYELKWWTDKLKPIITEFINVTNGNFNMEFWGDIFKVKNQSGGPYYNGWITHLFPYLVSNNQNKKNSFTSCTFQFTSGLSSVPVEWKYYDKSFKMNYVAGFFGYIVDNGVIKPEISWVIHENDELKGIDLYDDKIKQAYKNGVYYNPAWKHYGDNANIDVSCDICKKDKISACIGLGKNDICMKCMATFC